jgi:hypothetical protein
MKKLQVQIEDELLKDLKRLALTKDATLKEVVTSALNMYLGLQIYDDNIRRTLGQLFQVLLREPDNEQRIVEIIRASRLPKIGGSK